MNTHRGGIFFLASSTAANGADINFSDNTSATASSTGFSSSSTTVRVASAEGKSLRICSFTSITVTKCEALLFVGSVWLLTTATFGSPPVADVVDSPSSDFLRSAGSEEDSVVVDSWLWFLRRLVESSLMHWCKAPPSCSPDSWSESVLWVGSPFVRADSPEDEAASFCSGIEALTGFF